MTHPRLPPRFTSPSTSEAVYKEVVGVKVVLAIFAVVLAVPVALVIAIALGPVLLGLVCAVGFGLLVFVVGSLAIGLGKAGRSIERAGARHAHHSA
jgi:hypothetical protein